MSEEEVRIAKFISNSGFCSRRDAEKIILAKRVTVNNQIEIQLHRKILPTDIVKIDNKIIKPFDKIRVWAYHKPEGLITTRKDPQGRPTIYDNLPKSLKNLITIGRLDKNTEGLLLLTNNGDYSRMLELPENSYARTYRVRVFGKLNKMMFSDLVDGITIDGIKYKSISIVIESQTLNNSWLKVTLIEGKNREIRNVMDYFNLRIKRLIRVSYGPYKLGNLSKGSVIEVEKKC